MKHTQKKSPLQSLHKDWRTWVVIGLMLAAMGIYVLTLDDSMEPGISSKARIPSAGELVRPSS
jgi:uncharacterized membrane protein HdeD (DUF308 family)